MATEFCTITVTGTITSGPSTQSPTKKYVVVPAAGITWKLIGLNSLFSGLSVGQRKDFSGTWRENQPPAGALLHVVDVSTVNTPTAQTDGVGIAEHYGTVTQGATVKDANTKYFITEADSDPGEPKVVLRVENNNNAFAAYPPVVVGSRLRVGPGTLSLVSGVNTTFAHWSAP